MASLTLLYVTSVTPSAAKHWLSTQKELTEYPVSGPEPCTSLISQNANLNSMIQQFWIHCFFLCVKWAQVWRTSHARARQHQRDAWSCRSANIRLRGCSGGAVKPSLVPSGVYYSFFKDLLSLANKRTWLSFYLTLWQIFRWHTKKYNFQRLDGKVSGDSPVQMV